MSWGGVRQAAIKRATEDHYIDEHFMAIVFD